MITELAESVLTGLNQQYPVKVITIIGTKRHGQSDLASRLTANIWCWGRLDDVKKEVTLVLDTEGLWNVGKERANVDNTLGALVLTISSFIIYNQSGGNVDQSTLDVLGTFAELARKLCGHTSKTTETFMTRLPLKLHLHLLVLLRDYRSGGCATARLRCRNLKAAALVHFGIRPAMHEPLFAAKVMQAMQDARESGSHRTRLMLRFGKTYFTRLSAGASSWRRDVTITAEELNSFRLPKDIAFQYTTNGL
eukprot:jgi/Chlat1/1690/Chrsp127S01922